MPSLVVFCSNHHTLVNLDGLADTFQDVWCVQQLPRTDIAKLLEPLQDSGGRNSEVMGTEYCLPYSCLGRPETDEAKDLWPWQMPSIKEHVLGQSRFVLAAGTAQDICGQGSFF